MRKDEFPIVDRLLEQEKTKAISDYMLKAHSRILFELVDMMADLNENEILSHDNINEWLGIWKREVTDRILKSMIDAMQTGGNNEP